MSEPAEVLEIELELPEKLEFLLEKQARYKVAYGGRGSAKSWSYARALLIRGLNGQERVLCARETQTSIKESVHRLLCDQIKYLGLEDCYTILAQEIRGPGETVFTFAGLRSDPAAVKSTEGITIVWVEEAEAVSEASWEKLIPTIRRSGSEIWITFNPRWRTDPTWKRFVVEPPADAIVVKMNYSDNPWFPEVLEQERLEAKGKDLATYLHVWEGECGTTGSVFFAAEHLRLQDANIIEPIAVGILEQDGNLIRFSARSDGWLKVYEMPNKADAGNYVVGSDVSEGTDEGDRHSGHVFYRGATARQVARIVPIGEGPDALGRYLVRAAKWYGGRAVVAPERNSMGAATVIAVRDTGYEHLYLASDRKEGWHTNPVSRNVMLSDFSAGLRDGLIVLRADETLEECRTFIKTATGKPEAAPGCRDDEVMGAAIAYQLTLYEQAIGDPDAGWGGSGDTGYRP